MTQKCLRCEQVKDVTEFYNVYHKNGTIGRRLVCKSCVYDKIRKWQKENPDRTRERKLASYHRNSAKILKKRRDKYHNDPEYRAKHEAKAKIYRDSDRCKELAKKRRDQIKDECYAAYGGYICAFCGITDPLVLTIDHIGGLKPHNHPRCMRGDRLQRWLKKHNYPQGFRVLCMNCNCREYRKTLL